MRDPIHRPEWCDYWRLQGEPDDDGPQMDVCLICGGEIGEEPHICKDPLTPGDSDGSR